ncbi:MAG: site-specific DNA-methyltransferase, partial [Myxococcaceae bacterium]|nr:site-specific DNA-methyltransferase [Myxococcaceae bacterium]
MSIALARPSSDDSLASRVHSRGKDFVLYRGDCLDVLAKFDDHTFDLVFADPPYFLSNGGFTCQGGKRAPVKKGAWDESHGVEQDHDFTTEWLKAVKRVLKP